MESLVVIKIGGNIIDDEGKLAAFLSEFEAVKGKKILVHGGGKLATKLAGELGIQQQLIDGRRITDIETLKIVTMVYAGYINKNIVAKLQSLGCDAIGLSGVDGNAIQAHKRTHPSIDYGYVGDVDAIHTEFLSGLLQQGKTLVLAPITHDGKGQLLNTNADTIAQEIARGLSAAFEVSLVYSFEKNGVLMNAEDELSVINTIDPISYKELKERQVIFAGMIPKLDNAFAALQSGVSKVIIGKAEHLQELLAGKSGTTIMHA
jgi:acetylglutamate kinase